MSIAHRIRQGDCLASVALRYGFFPDTLWFASENASLRAERKNPHTLLPGDVLMIPERTRRLAPSVTEKRHRFRRKAVPAHVRIVLHDFEGQPRASLAYRAIIDGAEQTGKTDAAGALELAIPPHAMKGELLLGEPVSETVHLALGEIDPIDTLSGAQQRFTNLGFPCDSTDGRLDDTTITAIREFQEQYKLRATGKYDAATQNKLQEIYGC